MQSSMTISGVQGPRSEKPLTFEELRDAAREVKIGPRYIVVPEHMWAFYEANKDQIHESYPGVVWLREGAWPETQG